MAGYSSFKLVYGHVRMPLNFLHEGWRDHKLRKLNVGMCVEDLCDRLELLRESALCNSLTEGKKMKLITRSL